MTQSFNTESQRRSDGASSRKELPCVHCGLPTPCQADCDPRIVFCCSGCRQAYELIHGWGLDDYYAIRDQSTVAGSVQDLSAAGWESFDDELFLGASTPVAHDDGTMSTELSVTGLHCAACAWLIENVAARTDGWLLARVKLNHHTVRLVFNPQRIKLSQIARLIAKLGYGLAPLTSEPTDRFRSENRAMLMQIAIAGFCAANAMWIAVALYAGDASGVAPEHRIFLRIAGTVLGLASVLFPGRTFFISALASIRTRTPHMDLPVALGLAVGSTVGLYHAITDSGEIYFDSLAMLVFLLLIGRWIQFRRQHHAASAVDLLLRITPQHARLVSGEDDEGRLVLTSGLAAGQTIRVAAGESIPVDGILRRGHSTIDRSLLTGESVPVSVEVGEDVTAGTVNLSRPIEIEVTAIGKESRIGQVMQSVESAMQRRTPIVQLADRIGGVFVVVVTVLAVVAFAVWLPQGLDLATANATSLLIVACPCALALATPLAVAVTLGRAAKRKILIRDGDVFAKLGKPGVAWFDKTGTLTEGRPRAELIYGPEEILADAAAIESECRHPIANAIIREASLISQQTNPQQPSLVATDVEVLVGGVTGMVDGRRVTIGNQPLMDRQEIEISPPIYRAIDQCGVEGISPIIVAVDAVALAVIGVADRLKSDASAMITALQKQGWQVGILSGDHRDVVQNVARQLGIERDSALGDLSPEDKLAIVSDKKQHPVIMVGDGANDAASLAAADVGIAVRGGAEVSLQAACVFVASGTLRSIVELLHASRACNKLIGTAFAVSLAYNVFAVVLAIAGYISPLIAAILMPISSISVLSITLAWPTFRAVES
ncbi:heavy metal translocating P-type ATPase [Rhodopirellula sp. MGV]|uniref:heavy metal translocating P-type ATPase n=1 Tax=Rhodopirellula sp. MGV TaxID=2023130 RepID=UPI000B97818A|nr:heavy metal translocating P-type ATPase metal-binding domain-containing protein [Rhodopirellula sp. MGV]OYP38199.1 copper-translocating P-type ATPase [Rhodopirellula sp. MGV]PNY38534.1 heavy metal translocating P-type ATPase [Rhodopirellula baltica]